MRTLIALTALALPLAAALPLAFQKDYTNVPLDAEGIQRMQRDLAASKLSLADAVAAAVKETGGVADRAEYVLQVGKPVYEISAYADGKAWNVTVDANTGAVTKGEVPPYTFPGAAFDGAWTRTESGLRYVDIKEGSGPMPKGPKSQVQVHYAGFLIDGTPFDSSYDRNAPATFPLNGVIAGWTEGVGSMKVGGKRKLLIPSDLAYGDRGRPPQIPAKATLVFDVELLQIVSD